MGPLAVFGITSDGLSLVVNLLLLVLVVFWFALVYWTFADARRRIADPMLVGCATAASLFPFAGTIVYMIVRPPEYLDDVRERELEIAAAEVRLAAIENLTCSYCNYQIEQSFLRCPSCLRRLKEPCATCHKPLAPSWKICPYCESEIGKPAPQPRRRARPREAAAPARQPAGSERQRQAVAEAREPRRAAAGARAPAPAPRQRAATADAGDPASTAAARKGRNAAGERPARESRPRPQRPPATDGAGRPNGSDRQKRSGTQAGKRSASGSASDAVTTEQPVARPRTRPPSAG